ncbi:MAG: DNA-3-methyladenine glycosylase [Bacteroidetes bacterium]|nr:DNA-3-methyladenine glycosylase [Bacteroidota bacterium]
MAKLNEAFYLRDQVWQISKELIGKFLFTQIDGVTTGGMIVETEAYCGINDRACHANNGRRTKRNNIMYESGGRAYIYLCYGIHYLFNVVTNIKGRADAILVRAIEPCQGVEVMLKRRNHNTLQNRLTRGPGSLSRALGIGIKHNGELLLGKTIWIEDHQIDVEHLIHSGPRIGIVYAQEDVHKPWRFYVKDNPWVSKI